uniref:Cas scaffolding protein family member 4 n=1 Tax=Sphenodon punctatus TaxID=8508 RepID=A0A8D0GA07_SPHPU
MKVNNSLAKALYDNKAECSEELAFRKGDILTVLEQSVLGSEGWWKCSLHGRQGLAPANRLQLLTSSQADLLPLPTQHHSLALPANLQNIYQVPKSSTVSSTYERMDSWMKPPPATVSSSRVQETYQVPALAAQLLSEKTQCSTNQDQFTLPRVCRVSVPNIKIEMYDVPLPVRRVSLFTQRCATPPETRKGSKLLPSTEYFPEEQQQLYDIPSSPEKARINVQKETPPGNVYDVPPTNARETDISIPTASLGKYLGHCNTLPNPQKSDWIYDIPVSPEKPRLKQAAHNHSPGKQVLYDIPPTRFGSGLQNVPPTNNKGKVVDLQTYDIPAQRKLSFPGAPHYDVPPTRDMPLLQQNGNYDVPSSFLALRAENQKFQQNVYDIPKELSAVSGSTKEAEKSNCSSRDNTYSVPPQLSRDAKLDQDRLSVSSLESRTSTISTSSSASTESFSSTASLEEPTKEVTLELNLAIEMLTKLQHSVSSSVASLMIFVSSKWRHQEHLEKNIDEIHRAVEHIKVSLGEFLDFAWAIKANAACLTDHNLQTRIKKQLNILTDSFQIIVETRESLNNCKWSLEVLLVKKPQNSPDDLDRFVMLARTIPDDLKRFVSIIIANGKLLFRKSCKEKDTVETKVDTEFKRVKPIPLPRRREFESIQRNTLDKPNESKLSSEKSNDIIEDCDYVQLQKPAGVEQTTKTLSAKEVAKNTTDLKTEESPPTRKLSTVSKQDPTKKITLSDPCRLYFDALQKAISEFNHSLSNNQPPEKFIAHSKLIIMVGQKLVDSLCQEVLAKDARNDILCCSSRFCSLLKNLAVDTKTAAMQYPNSDAARELQNRADEISKYTQQFRVTMK